MKKAGDVVGVKLRPHGLRRRAAIHASRSGVPVEIVSKVILRHTNLATTQRYLGKVTDTEAIRWIDNLYPRFRGGVRPGSLTQMLAVLLGYERRFETLTTLETRAVISNFSCDPSDITSCGVANDYF